MNQAFGGAFLIKIALIFLSIYIVILGFAMNYARVFTMKNRIIVLIEQYEGYDEKNDDIMDEIKDKIGKLNYMGATTGRLDDCENKRYEKYYCIKAFTANNNTTYYRVTTYIQFDIPIFNSLASGVIPITGETRYIYDFESK